jgi:hypothetical protein
MKMFRNLFLAVALLLALNFIALASGFAWLYKSGHLDRAKIASIREIVFPPTSEPSTQPSGIGDAGTQPSLSLQDMLAKQVGRSSQEQLEFIQHSFEQLTLQHDEKQRELQNLQRTIDAAAAKLALDRADVNAQRQALADQQQQAQKLQSDQGFQDSLALYNSMQAKQVKTIFMGLDDATLSQYLQAMEPRSASKIIKEFKTPDELARIQKILERIRQQQAATPTTKE